jgi:hypothetical protein
MSENPTFSKREERRKLAGAVVDVLKLIGFPG